MYTCQWLISAYFSQAIIPVCQDNFNSSPVLLLNFNNYTHSSIILLININIQLYSVLNRCHQNHNLYWILPIQTLNTVWGLMKLETGRASYLNKSCCSRRRKKAYWQFTTSYRIFYVINCSGFWNCYVCALYSFSLLQYSFSYRYIAQEWERTVSFFLRLI